MAVDMGVDTIHSLEDLAYQGWEGLWEGDAYAAGHDSLIVNTALNPSHELLDVSGCSHLGRTLKVLVVLPEILEPD